MRRFLLSINLIALLLLLLPASATGAPQQIFKYSNRASDSRLLGAQGVSGYVVSQQGSNRGFVITGTASGSLAERIGLTAGDVLLKLDDNEVVSSGQADHILSQRPSGVLHVIFVRPREQGLNLYNQMVPYENYPPLAPSRLSVINSSKPSITELEAQALELVNSDRKKNGVEPVALSPVLSGLARAYAEDMSKRGFKGHIDPEGRNPIRRAQDRGIKVGVSENLAWSIGLPSLQNEIKVCENSMMNEPADTPHNHRGNILNPSHTVVGIGVAVGPGTQVILVQEFADQAP